MSAKENITRTDKKVQTSQLLLREEYKKLKIQIHNFCNKNKVILRINSVCQWFLWASHSTVFIQLSYYHWLHRNHILAVGCRCRTLLVAVSLHAWLPCIGLSQLLSHRRPLFAQEVKYMLRQRKKKSRFSLWSVSVCVSVIDTDMRV